MQRRGSSNRGSIRPFDRYRLANLNFRRNSCQRKVRNHQCLSPVAVAIKLTRDFRSRSGTHGTFQLGGRLWHSLEQPELGNTPFKSCVPQGEYVLVPWDSRKYGKCYVMVNPDLNVYHSKDSHGRPENGRFKCLFVHRGNFVRNFQGCVGVSHGYDDINDMLLSSTTRACEIVNELVEQEGSYKLIIQHVFE